MSDEHPIPRAKVKRLKSISIIWLIPIIAVLIGGWMIYFHLSGQGTLITIHFKTGEGIEAGKTKIKIKNVEVGVVKAIALNKNLQGVVVTARIQKNNEYLLKEDTQFWVVRPRIGQGGVSGLGTLLSGAYIELSPGKTGDEHDVFNGLENEPVTPAGTPGLHITLEGGSDYSLQVGDPILFHGFDVGRIEQVNFDADKRQASYDAFIESPYDRLITTNTSFWDVSGIEVNSSADGIQLRAGTLESIIAGGVTFDVPKDLPRGQLVPEYHVFTVYPDKESVSEHRYQYALTYILLFKDSVRGLEPGAPVEYRGIKIGTVSRVDVKYPEITNVLDQDTLIPVMISIKPGKMGFEDKEDVLPEAAQQIEALLKKGLTGGLVTGNLLTGSKYIELQYKKQNNKTYPLDYFSGYVVIPTLEGQLDQILAKTNKLMDKLNNLPIEPIINNTDAVMRQVRSTLAEFQSMTVELERFIKQSSDANLANNIEETLNDFKKLLADFSRGSLTHDELQDTLRVIKDSFAELEPLLLQLNQKDDDLEPKGINR